MGPKAVANRIAASIRTSEHNAKRSEAAAKKVLSGESPDEYQQARLLSVLYYDMVKAYRKDFRKPKEFGTRAQRLWTRVAEAQEGSGAEPQAFLKAQFAWFDKVFGKAPTPVQLTTEGAILRARSVVPPKGNIRATYQLIDIPLPAILRHAEKQMLDVCKAQDMTKEEVYRELVLTGELTFPKEYLERDPIYHKVVREER